MTAQRPRVLLVDDDPSALETTEALLAALYDVTTATGGERAMVPLRTTQFDVVCTDHAMPGMHGIELLQQATRLQRHFAGVLMTGSVEAAAALDVRRFYTVLKPCSPHHLLDIVARAARQAANQRGKVTGARLRVSLELEAILSAGRVGPER